MGRFSLSKKYYFNFYASCGSTHKIEFAKQIHKFREHVSRNLYKGRKNVPVGRGFSSVFARKRGFEREAARKTIVFRQPQASQWDAFRFSDNPCFNFAKHKLSSISIMETKKPEKSRQKAAGCRNTQEVIYTQPLFITPFYLLKGYRSDRLDINIPVIPKAARRDGFTR